MGAEQRSFSPTQRLVTRPFDGREFVNSSTLQKEKETQERFFTRFWLQNEVEKVKRQPLPRGETPWYHLAGTGFWVKEQVAQLLHNASGIGRETFPDVLDLELAKVKVDIEYFEQEYLRQMASIKWSLAWGEINGVRRVICPDYGAKLLQAVTDKKEREGVLFETLFGDQEKGATGVEARLRTAPSDSFAIIVSPDGWSGLIDPYGRQIRYPETQVYAIHKKADDSLEAYTFRYDATIIQNEELQRRLGLSIPEADNQKARIKNIVKNVALFTPEDVEKAEQGGRIGIRSFDNILMLMQEVVGGREIAYDGDGNPKTFAEIRGFLHNPIARSHPLTEKLIKRFQDYARVRFTQENAENLEQDLQIALALTLLHLNRLYRNEEQAAEYTYSGTGLGGQIYPASPTTSFVRQAAFSLNYTLEKNDLQNRPGCAGGGGKNANQVILASFMGVSRKGKLTESSKDYDFDHNGTCVVCKQGPKALGPCDICISCDAAMGGKGKELIDSG